MISLIIAATTLMQMFQRGKYIRHKEARGLASAIYLAKSFVGDEPFAVLLGDIVTYYRYPFLKLLISTFGRYDAPIIGVNQVDMSEVSNYGIVSSRKQSDATACPHPQSTIWILIPNS